MKLDDLDKKIDFKKEKIIRLFVGMMSLSVGLIFIIPGIYFLLHLINMIFVYNEIPNLLTLGLITFMLSIGIMLILLTLKFCINGFEKQKLSSPIIICVSILLIIVSISMIIHYVNGGSFSDPRAGRAMAGGLLLGSAGIYVVFNRRNIANDKIDKSLSD